MSTVTHPCPRPAEDTLPYELVRDLRDRAWDALTPHMLVEDVDGDTVYVDRDKPEGDAEHYWYHQGRTEAFAEVMSLLERPADHGAPATLAALDGEAA